MGDYSRDPSARLDDAVSKQYVGVRLQQGVPFLDADWNELDGLHRHALEEVGTRFIGEGVPVGSDGFRVLALPNGGVDLLVVAAEDVSHGHSRVDIDVEASTAAAALGFTAETARADRPGSSPVHVVGRQVGPFALEDGSTLVVQINERPPQTVTFEEDDFDDIASVAVEDVATVIDDQLDGGTARASTGNDVIIRGSRADTVFGGILAGGRLVVNPYDILFSQQPLHENTELAEEWQVDTVEALFTPDSDSTTVLYLDTWEREIQSTDDPALVDERIGVETSTRLKHEWAVRATSLEDYAAVEAARPSGHRYTVLANVTRSTGTAAMSRSALRDRRITDLGLRREVAYRDIAGTVVVDSRSVRETLTTVRNAVQSLHLQLVSSVMTPSGAYRAGEALAVDVLRDLARTAEQGIALVRTDALGTQDALVLFDELHGAQSRFVDTWTDVLLPLTRGGEPVYQQNYQDLLTDVGEHVDGPPPSSGLTPLVDAIEARNLFAVTRTQDRINSLLGSNLDRPTGVFYVNYTGSPDATIEPGASFDLQYELTGRISQPGVMRAEIAIGTGWTVTLANADGSLPFDPSIAPAADDSFQKPFIVRVLPPNTDGASTLMSMLVYAEGNRSGLARTTPQQNLVVGQAPPSDGSDYEFEIVSAPSTPVDGVYVVPVGVDEMFRFRLNNRTDDDLDVEFEFEPSSEPPNWSLVWSHGTLSDTVAANDFEDYDMLFEATSPDVTLTFTIRARDQATTDVAGEATVSLRSEDS